MRGSWTGRSEEGSESELSSGEKGFILSKSSTKLAKAVSPTDGMLTGSALEGEEVFAVSTVRLMSELVDICKWVRYYSWRLSKEG